MLSKEQNDKWESYCQAEKNRIRSVMKVQLDQFISLLLKSDSQDYAAWVYELSARVVDHDDDIPVRMPLFEKIIFPVLWAGCKSRKEGCARWLSGFNQLIYQSKIAQQELGANFSEVYFLRLAVEHNSSDKIAKKKLLKALAWQLDYAIHEVPYGVLWGNNSASIEQCALLLDELKDFEKLADEVEERQKYAVLIKDCSFHFSEYSKYLSNTDRYKSYENYISSLYENNGHL